MADNNPNPGTPIPPAGGPPKPEVKKQTVRISLPPKPTATIKLPTLPGGAPAAAGASPASAPPPTGHAAPHAPPPSAARPAPPAPPAGATAARVAAPKSAAPSAAPAAARPPAMPAGGAKRISGLDLGLSIAAAVIGLGAVGSLLLLLNLK